MKLRKRKQPAKQYDAMCDQQAPAPKTPTSTPEPADLMTPRIGAILRARQSSENALNELKSQLRVTLSTGSGFLETSHASVETSGAFYIFGKYSGHVSLDVDEVLKLRAWLNEIFADTHTNK